MIRRLIILLLIVGCEEPIEPHTTVCMEENTCEELEELFEQTVIEYNNAVNDIPVRINLMDSINTCLENNCPSSEPYIDYGFPLQIGNTWTYDYYYLWGRTFAPEYGWYLSPIIDTTYFHTFQITVRIVEQTIIVNSLNVYELEFHFVNDDTSFYEFAYINENPSGLYLYATKEKGYSNHIYQNYLPRSDNYNETRINNLFFGSVLPDNIAESVCSDYFYTIFGNPLKVLEYPIQLNKYWINTPMESIHYRVCEANNEVIGSYASNLFALKGYADISEGCLITETYATLPLLHDELSYLFNKKYCDYGIESILNTYGFGEKTGMDQFGNPTSSFHKLEISFQLTETNVISDD